MVSVNTKITGFCDATLPPLLLWSNSSGRGCSGDSLVQVVQPPWEGPWGGIASLQPALLLSVLTDNCLRVLVQTL